MKQIKPSERNRMIAEILEPKPAGVFVIGMSGRSFKNAWRYGELSGWQPLDFLLDPRGTVMLIEALVKKPDFSQSLEIYYDVLALNQYGDDGPDSGTITMFKKASLGEAVAHAFLRANGYEVSK